MAVVVGLGLASATAPQAQGLASCYDAKLPAPGAALSKELFVVVDQTVILDDGLKQSVANQIRPFVAPGHALSVLVFSAYTQGKYTRELTTARLDHPLPAQARNDVPKQALAKFDKCFAAQPVAAGQLMGAALRDAFQGSSGEIAKSDVLASLKDISGKVRQSRANEKVVVVVSDMLENSSVSSFYAGQTVRKIDPDRELKLAVEQQLLADFAGARLYVIGAGLLNDSKNRNAYRDPKTMLALKNFWQAFFDKSSAKLVEFGQPALLNPVQ